MPKLPNGYRGVATAFLSKIISTSTFSRVGSTHHSLVGDQPNNKMNVIEYAALAGLYKGRLESLKYNLRVFELLDENEDRMKEFQSIIESLVNNVKITNTEL